MGLVARLFLTCVICRAVAFLHHGHIEMFISAVRAKFERGRPLVVGDGEIQQESSRLSLFPDGVPWHYEVVVRRKTRSVDTGLCLHGDRAANERWLEMLAEHADEIRARLGSTVEPERLTTTSSRLHETQMVSTADDWSPKRDLTPAVVDDVSRRLARFVEVFEPLLRREWSSHSNQILE